MKNLFKTSKLKLWQKYCEIQRKKHPFTYLFWECSLRCNLACQHCGSSCGPERINKDELTTEEIKNVFRTIAEDFNPKQITIAVTGGEPLLRKDIFEVMRYANELGFSWGMVTNGALITPGIVSQMQKTKMSTISVSLDGLENNHNWLRNSKDVFKKTINGIKLLVSSKSFDVVEVISCINQNNFNELEEIYQLCNNLGVDKWRIFIISPIGRAKSNSKLFLDGQQLFYLLKYIKDKHREKKNKPEVSFCDEGFLGLEYEGEVRNQLFYCWAGISVGSILYNGDIAACPILPREYVQQGNVRQDRFSEIWNNKYELFRDRNWRKCGDCKNCSWWEFCEGNSLHLWNFNDNKLTLCNYNLINQERSYQNKNRKNNMYKKPTNRIFKKLKGLGSSVLGGLLSLIFTSGANAQSMPFAKPLYGIQPTPGEILSRLFPFLPFIGGVFLLFVIAPVAGLIWYRKHGGTKKWPSVIVWILATLFVLALITLIILLYPYLRN